MKVKTPATGKDHSEVSESFDISVVLAKIWASRRLMGLFVALGIFMGLFMFATTAKVYQADALLQLESKGGQLGLPKELAGLTDSGSKTETEVEILRSRLVLGQAMATLHLDWHAEPVLAPLIGVAVQRYDLPLPDVWPFKAYARRAESISLDLLQVGPSWIGEELLVTLTADNSYDVQTPDGEVFSGVLGETLSVPEKNFALRIAALTGSIGRTFTLEQRSELKTISDIRTSLSVEEQGRNSGILLLRYTAASQDAAQRVLNAISEAYVQQNVARGVANADSGLEFLDKQLPIAEKDVRDAEEALNIYRRKFQVVDLSFESQAMLTQVEKINADLQQLQSKEDELKRRYTPNHPVYQQLLNDRARLQAQLEGLRKEADGLPETQRNILNLTHEVELAQEAYTQLQSRAQEVRVMRASDVGSVRVIDLAQTAERPVAPRGSVLLLVWTFLGGLLGAGVVLARDALRRGVQGAEQIETLGMPVLATINYVAGGDASANKSNDSQPIIALTDPGNLAVEAFRSLRTSLHFSMLDAKNNTMIVTSSAPGSGKSFTSVNLAVVMAQAGQNICLIDTDMRRGHLRKFFNLKKNTPGLSEYLAEEKTLDEVLLPGPIKGLSYINNGRHPPNPADLLTRQRMSDLLATLGERFDLVILDTPPVLAVADPVILGRISGSVLLVARHCVTPLGEIEASRNILETAGLKITGTVLNGFDPSRASSTSHNYRYDYQPKTD